MTMGACCGFVFLFVCFLFVFLAGGGGVVLFFLFCFFFFWGGRGNYLARQALDDGLFGERVGFKEKRDILPGVVDKGIRSTFGWSTILKYLPVK